MTIARRLARAVNGEIWYAHDGREAAFTLTLPASKPADPTWEPAGKQSTNRDARRRPGIAYASPRHHYDEMRWLARTYFRLRGWEYVGTKPEARKFVAIGAPHTSNWDFVILLAVASHFGFKPKTIGKETLVRGPFGGLMRRLGIIPLRRDSGQGMVEQMARAFADSADLALVLAPEGTRRAEPYWRSGFYQIALAAGVPIVPARVDAGRKQAGLGTPFIPTGDVAADMDRLRDFYAGAVGFNPGGESTIRLREEDAPADS